MACDSFATIDPAKQIVGLSSYSAPPVGAGFNGLGYIAQLIADNIPGAFTCDQVPGLLDTLIGNGTNILLAPDTYFVQPPSVSDFSLNGGANGFVEFDLTFFGFGVGYIRCEFVAGVPTFTNFSTWTTPLLVSDFNGSLGVGRRSFGGDEIIYKGTYPAVTAFPDPQAYINCAIPVCAIIPPPSDPVAYNPSLGLRCANFSKVINPFGFQRK